MSKEEPEELMEKIGDFRRGKPVLIYDWPERENEVDMVFYAGSVGPKEIFLLRMAAGGLICYATSYSVAEKLNLKFLADALANAEGFNLLLTNGPAYDVRSGLLIWLNSVRTRTGISDVDRAETIMSLHGVVKMILRGRVEEAKETFYKGFYFPGHIPLLASTSLKSRRGHTELSVALASLAGLEPSVVFAEMLDYNRPLSFEKALEYAKRENLVLLRGEDILRFAAQSEGNV